MNISYNSHHVEITDSLKSYFEKKLLRIDQYDHLIGKVNVFFSVDSSYVHQVEMELEFAKWKTLFFSSRDTDMYRAIDNLFDRVEKNISKLKAKVVDHKQNEPLRKLAQIFESDEKNKIPVQTIDFTQINKKPMSPIDAMHILHPKKKLDFVFFYNYEIESNNIIPSLMIKIGDKEFLLVEKFDDINDLILHKIEKVGFNKIEIKDKQKVNLAEKTIEEAINSSNKEPYYFFINSETKDYSCILKQNPQKPIILNILTV